MDDDFIRLATAEQLERWREKFRYGWNETRLEQQARGPIED